MIWSPRPSTQLVGPTPSHRASAHLDRAQSPGSSTEEAVLDHRRFLSRGVTANEVAECVGWCNEALVTEFALFQPLATILPVHSSLNQQRHLKDGPHSSDEEICHCYCLSFFWARGRNPLRTINLVTTRPTPVSVSRHHLYDQTRSRKYRRSWIFDSYVKCNACQRAEVCPIRLPGRRGGQLYAIRDR
ncbi:uncharacterized protein EI97DRAFT_161585 [Westerdykella ornata]|uniref:Uncharacterized protein n=1 Tax=Westerdykella ornata TaxID=318751 RepID=A0A6A6JAI8_WESOR|nr:uncharacterized protein EI97DRAFT_161585 [Westerdykella ornata]KAF2273335.1 hypothetical protein EI97DRAFT_161585 [Westerdykella ornata]